jgi:hypothetical protein
VHGWIVEEGEEEEEEEEEEERGEGGVRHAAMPRCGVAKGATSVPLALSLPLVVLTKYSFEPAAGPLMPENSGPDP